MGSVERFLTAASYLVSLTAVALATSAPGALAAGLGALTSLNKLREDLTAKVPDLNRRVAEALAEALTRSPGLPREADLLIPQMIEFGALTPAEVMSAGRTADGVCQAMLDKLKDSEHRRDEMKNAFGRVVRPILEDLLNDPKVSDTLRPAFETAVMQTLATIAAQTDKLVQASDRNAKQLGLQTGMLVALARTYAEGEPDDFDSAYRGLERALRTAAEMRTALPSNLGEAVNKVIARVNELNDAGQISQAGAELRKALVEQEEREAEAEAATIILLRQVVDQAILERSVPDATTFTLRLLAREGAPESYFARLCALQHDWYVRGRDKVLKFDLEVALALAREGVDQAAGQDQKALALLALGNVLQTLGTRDSGTARLEAAVAVFKATLHLCPRSRVPLERAKIQNNLGNALWTLGERANDIRRLEDAVGAYRFALEEWTRAESPQNWAMAKNNLGVALKSLGQRADGTAQLEEAIKAFRAALEVWTREGSLHDWAMAKNNLGNALRTVGQREDGTTRLEEAVEVFRAALDGVDRRDAPLEWAGIQNNLGIAMTFLGQKTDDPKLIETAIEAYRAALEERSPDRVPFHWAKTQENIAFAELVRAIWVAPEPAQVHLEAAHAACDRCLEVYHPQASAFYHSKATALLGEIQSARASLDAGVWPPIDSPRQPATIRPRSNGGPL